ncbi:hypothetical protein [Labilibaculum euxinus]
MSTSRKDFIKKLCVSGTCLCGFSSIMLTAKGNDNTNTETTSQNEGNQLIQEWISNVLSNLDIEIDKELIRGVLKKSSVVHYNNLKMDEMLSNYIGDLDKFINFIEDKWNWKIDYNKTTKTLIADENKNHCVCPISNYEKGINSSAMCFCSEGFAEKMFSTVAGIPASAEVISSIRRGDDSCKYKIKFQD